MLRWILILIVFLLAGGCVNTRAHLESIRDPKFQISPQQRFAIHYDADKSIEHRQLHQRLTDEFNRQGIPLTGEDQADYIIHYTLMSQTVRQRDYRPYTSTDHYAVRLNGKNYHGTTTSTEYLPYETDTTSRTLRLMALPGHSDDQPAASAWECSLTTRDQVFENYLNDIVRIMVESLGRDQRLTVSLKDQHRPR